MLSKPHLVVAQAWRWWLRAKFLLTQRRRHDRLVIDRAAGRQFVVLPGVFNPALFYSSEFLAAALEGELAPAGLRVLDLGTGSGVLAIAAARSARQVVAVDINPAAVRCARINALLHRVEQAVEVREGDLFAPAAGERFDLVLFNPPYYRGAPRNDLDRAFRAVDVLERFAAGLGGALAPGGRALLVLSTNSEQAALLGLLAGQGFASRPLLRQDKISETLTIYEVTAERGGRDARAV
ncbi:MAG TPA: methyltransferase [Herpetosiphonaceae bacterium]